MATPEEMALKMIENMPEKTGKSLNQWLQITAAMQSEKHGAIVKFLKTDHGLTHGFANLIAHETLKSASMHAEDADLIESQYAGDKAPLKAIYNALVEILQDSGTEYSLAPKKSLCFVAGKKAIWPYSALNKNTR